MSYAKLLPKVLATALGCLLVSTGFMWHLDPIGNAHTFGIVDDTKHPSVLGPAIGGRNASCGLAILLLTLAGQRRALGILFACWTLTGLADIGVCLRDGTNVSYHFPGTLACITMGATFLMT